MLAVWVAGLIFATHFSFWKCLTESQVNSEYQRLWKYPRDTNYKKTKLNVSVIDVQRKAQIKGAFFICEAAVKAFVHLLTRRLSRRVSNRKVYSLVSNVLSFQVRRFAKAWKYCFPSCEHYSDTKGCIRAWRVESIIVHLIKKHSFNIIYI